MRKVNHDRIFDALNNFNNFTGEVVEFAAATFGGLKIGNDIHNFGRSLGVNKQEARDTAKHQGFVLALSLLAVWGALEAFVEDFCKAVISSDPSVIEGSDIAKQRVTIDNLFVSDEEKTDIIFKAIEGARGGRGGTNQFESSLKFLSLDGKVPDRIGQAIYDAQKIRNVWAHKKGVADQQFVADAAHLGFTVGQRVPVLLEDFLKYVQAMMMYSFIVANRHFISKGSPIASAETLKPNMFHADYVELYKS